MKNKVYAFLGMAQGAGKIASGETGAELSIKKQKAALVIIACDASDNTKKKFENMCKYRRIPYCFYGTKEKIGDALGKAERSVLAVEDDGFSSGISLRMEQETEER